MLDQTGWPIGKTVQDSIREVIGSNDGRDTFCLVSLKMETVPDYTALDLYSHLPLWEPQIRHDLICLKSTEWAPFTLILRRCCLPTGAAMRGAATREPGDDTACLHVSDFIVTSQCFGGEGFLSENMWSFSSHVTCTDKITNLSATSHLGKSVGPI
jgi:hypothetical protein